MPWQLSSADSDFCMESRICRMKSRSSDHGILASKADHARQVEKHAVKRQELHVEEFFQQRAAGSRGFRTTVKIRYV